MLDRQPDRANMQLQANGPALHDLTYQLITQQSQYGPFSNIGYSDERGGHYNSIENMHNGIHMLVGNGGHMSNIPYSSFDPIFWLHHVNVDRLFALWQAIYPNSTVTPQVNAAGTYTDEGGKTEDINTLASHSVVDTSLLSAANPDNATKLYGQIPLNHALLAAGNSVLAPANIVPFLTSQLNWRLQNTDESPLDIGQVPNLKIHVVGQEVKQTAAEDQFPEYGQMQVYKAITAGKAGGLGDDDDPD
ncbi:MAG: hypothetical protein Q9208_006938 [Pyrenodesmia sp. 3 TL-2023]